MKNKYSEIINELTDKELIRHLYTTQIILIALSLVLSIFLFDEHSFWQQINLFDLDILTIGLTAGLLVVLIDFLFTKWLPSTYYDDGGLNERIFRNQNFVQIFWITIFVAFSEEMLFRGIIQTKIGLIWACLLFAAVHYRYLFNWFLFLNIILLSFLIGFIFAWTNNLAVTIVMHFVIDFLSGIQIRWKNINKVNEQEGSFHE
ncbi:CPBP family intramembrane glutamic endopeptidase [Bacillus sp. EB600]|uniref:CPBP family intramembrane glutamic endopeptidase n=1 Tax=Bacillus sp. EB600 TaxID=2806345 RepID=UPI00210F05A8|nr:type II CAAX endopeptidase family protein [Bacillus sp. EB600]MCQ6277951.1 CPBP family intramembrane metalloprotease [Bacillus sp. EB600]